MRPPRRCRRRSEHAYATVVVVGVVARVLCRSFQQPIRPAVPRRTRDGFLGLPTGGRTGRPPGEERRPRWTRLRLLLLLLPPPLLHSWWDRRKSTNRRRLVGPVHVLHVEGVLT